MPSKIRCLAQDFGSKPIRRVARGGRRGCSVSTSLTLLLAILESAPARLSQTRRSEVPRGPGVPPVEVLSKVLFDLATTWMEFAERFPENASGPQISCWKPRCRFARAVCNQRYGKSREDSGHDAAHPPKLWHRSDTSLGRSPRTSFRRDAPRFVGWSVRSDEPEVRDPAGVTSWHRFALSEWLSATDRSCRAPEKFLKED